MVTLHRIIAEAFIEKEKGKPEVNHIDGNKLNNSIENLEWCNRSENVQHSYSIGLRTGSIPNKLKAENVKEIRKLYIEGYSQVKISKLFNVSVACINSVVNYRNWKDV